MSIFNDKTLKSVAEVAAKIMEAELSSKQKAIAKISEPKDKIDAGDLAKLRAGHKPVKEEMEKHEDEAQDKVLATGIAKKEVKKHEKRMHHKEEVEQIVEYESKNGVYTHKGTYGTAKGAEYGSTQWDKEEEESKNMGAKPKKPASRKLGARQNYVRSTRVNESFTEMIASYDQDGLKSLSKMSQMNEEPDNETFTKEVEDQKASMMGKKKQPAVAAPATQGVKVMPEEVELNEGRPSQRHPLEGHAYHKKSDAELNYIAKDAREAAEAMKGHNTQAENKYRDQVNDSATVRHWRQQNGMPDWYKKKYGHIKEETEQISEEVPMSARTLYAQTYAKHAKTIMNSKEAQQKAYDAVEKKHGANVLAKLKAHHENNMKEEVEQINDVNGVRMSTIEERTLTEPEAKKKEEIVKSMKKKLPGFKERYGDRAKEVLYATATKIAKEKA